ncbi:uncharacterized protein HMPREF1541_07615 [Cyphellophora europaea CBS 101466]|uniref:HhH-GPD domain-containing protein n=1 Tax=Cyphellophora europaea (strain CBS 101466) TaxID=1220924 RepID=W2RNF7_CYPE1|nr:uncharacterized protein HMPREF1541_07615 [Cyphellophora europaea CBS 101466]ETN37992.1 hypothetical protein HMPREF1541_07615 [Cyphellophora europaea CBS 101466]
MAPRSKKAATSLRKTRASPQDSPQTADPRRTSQRLRARASITTASVTTTVVTTQTTVILQEETPVAISQPVLSKKRKIDGPEDEYSQTSTPLKKRTISFSHESNPSLGTRSKTKRLGLILAEGQTSTVSTPEKDAAPVDPTVKAEPTTDGPASEVSTKVKPKKSSILAHVVERLPHPDSKGQKFKSLRFRYPIKRLPLDYLHAIPINERNININAGALRIRKSSAFWDNQELAIKFCFSPFLSRPEPTPQQCRDVWSILDKWLRSRDTPIIVEPVGTSSGTEGPMHGSTGVTVDCLVRTIMSQATLNDLALQVQTQLTQYFPYMVNGERIAGELPNFHTMRTASLEDLEKAIKRGGLFQRKAKTIQSCLNAVYDENVKQLKAANGGTLPDGTCLGQEPNSPEFVPGLLSMNFINGLDMVEVFNFLVGIPGIGHKTASCILEFNYGFPICAVDVHVHKMTKWLGWVPQDSNELQAFKHLEGRIPNHLKHLLHQAFWHHPQLCKPCKKKFDAEKSTTDEAEENSTATPTKNAPKESKKGSAQKPREPGQLQLGFPLAKKEVQEDRDEEEMVLGKKVEVVLAEICPLEHLLTRIVRKVSPKKEAGRKKKASTSPLVKKEKGPAEIKPWDAFENEAEAALAGYVALNVNHSDDFNAGSANTRVKRQWFRQMGVSVETKVEVSEEVGEDTSP